MAGRVSLISLLGVSLAAAAALAQSQETEPNNSKASATLAVVAPGGTFSGNATGFTDLWDSSITGTESRDLWRVKTPVRAPGIYKYTIRNISGTPHYAALLGQSQEGCAGNNDDSFIMFEDPYWHWYGFGKEESVCIVIGVGLDPSDPPENAEYVFQLQSEPVVPSEAAGSVTAGQVTITVDAENGDGEVDADTWLYDSNFNAIPGAGNNDSAAGDPGGPSVISRNLSPGVYYLAIGLFDLISNQTCAAGDFDHYGQLLDYPDAVCCSNGWVTDAFYNVTIADSDAGTSDVSLARVIPNYYEVAWVKFTVTGGANPCRGDFNGVGGVTVQDIFDFLSAWFGGQPSADFNHAGGVTVQDIFDFLSAWFAGC